MKNLLRSISISALACGLVLALALAAGLAVREQPRGTVQTAARPRLKSMPVLGQLYFVLMKADSATDKPVS